jgi:hypothetical protein
MATTTAFGRFYDSLFGLMPFMPMFVALVAGPIAASVRCRRTVHAIAFVVMPLTMPLYLLGLPVFAPISAEYPGAGDGFAVLMWMVVLALTVFFYAIHVWLSSRDIAAANHQAS